MSETRQAERWAALNAAQAQLNKEERRYFIGAGVMIFALVVGCVAMLGSLAASLR